MGKIGKNEEGRKKPASHVFSLGRVPKWKGRKENDKLDLTCFEARGLTPLPPSPFFKVWRSWSVNGVEPLLVAFLNLCLQCPSNGTTLNKKAIFPQILAIGKQLQTKNIVYLVSPFHSIHGSPPRKSEGCFDKAKEKFLRSHPSMSKRATDGRGGEFFWEGGGGHAALFNQLSCVLPTLLLEHFLTYAANQSGVRKKNAPSQ